MTYNVFGETLNLSQSNPYIVHFECMHAKLANSHVQHCYYAKCACCNFIHPLYLNEDLL